MGNGLGGRREDSTNGAHALQPKLLIGPFEHAEQQGGRRACLRPISLQRPNGSRTQRVGLPWRAEHAHQSGHGAGCGWSKPFERIDAHLTNTGIVAREHSCQNRCRFRCFGAY
jgi:hypothetical protein